MARGHPAAPAAVGEARIPGTIGPRRRSGGLPSPTRGHPLQGTRSRRDPGTAHRAHVRGDAPVDPRRARGDPAGGPPATAGPGGSRLPGGRWPAPRAPRPEGGVRCAVDRRPLRLRPDGQQDAHHRSRVGLGGLARARRSERSLVHPGGRGDHSGGLRDPPQHLGLTAEVGRVGPACRRSGPTGRPRRFPATRGPQRAPRRPRADVAVPGRPTGHPFAPPRRT